MDFGKVPPTELNGIDFSLPQDPHSNKQVLSGTPSQTQFYLGCAKWGRKEWVGTWFPSGTKPAHYLAAYARQFNSVEFNGFAYQTYAPAQVAQWAAMVPPGFLFCPKFPQFITHIKRLKEVEAGIDKFLNSIIAFGERLGPLLLLPHPAMSPDADERIRTFLFSVPHDLPLFLELRHPAWFAYPGGMHTGMLHYLQSHQRGLAITDVAGRRDVLHMHLTTPSCFIRFVGNGLHPTDYQRIDEWVERLALWQQHGLQQCYFFMHQPDERHGPELLRYMIQALNKKCHAGIPSPHNYTAGTLF